MKKLQGMRGAAMLALAGAASSLSGCGEAENKVETYYFDAGQTSDQLKENFDVTEQQEDLERFIEGNVVSVVSPSGTLQHLENAKEVVVSSNSVVLISDTASRSYDFERKEYQDQYCTTQTSVKATLEKVARWADSKSSVIACQSLSALDDDPSLTKSFKDDLKNLAEAQVSFSDDVEDYDGAYETASAILKREP